VGPQEGVAHIVILKSWEQGEDPDRRGLWDQYGALIGAAYFTWGSHLNHGAGLLMPFFNQETAGSHHPKMGLLAGEKLKSVI